MRINRPIRFALVLAGLTGGWFAAGLLGDHGGPPPAPPPAAPADPATKPAPATRPATTRPAGLGVIRGKVLFRGEPPERKPVPGIMASARCAAMHKEAPLDETVIVSRDGALRNAVVYLKHAPPNAPPNAPAALPADWPPVLVEMVDCLYEPHVVAARVGQRVRFENRDPFLHNVHSLPTVSDDPGCKAQPSREGGYHLTVKAAEIFKVKCDVHPWMSMWIAAFDHPYFAVTGDDGAYEIAGLPPGEYTVVAWQEKYKERERTVVVPPTGGDGAGAGAAVGVDFTYEPLK
jgi:plastocyanin